MILFVGVVVAIAKSPWYRSVGGRSCDCLGAVLTILRGLVIIHNVFAICGVSQICYWITHKLDILFCF